MALPPTADRPFAELASYLFSRRDAILNRWRTACESDPSLPGMASMNREEFNNLIPVLLNTLDQRLRQQTEGSDPLQVGKAHGLHRWHKGLALTDLFTELDHLYQVLTDEVRDFLRQNSDTDSTVILAALEQIAYLKSETVRGSAAEYDTQQQITAASRGAGLQQALDQLNQLGQDRSELLRTSSHDLKSSFGAIQGAAFLLNREGKTEEERTHLTEMLNRNLTNIRTMLVQLTDLARLEAGQESVEVTDFDAAQLLRELVESVRPLLGEKKLVLRADGPETLPVHGDVVKIQRIVQNLVLNAIRYTAEGTVSVSWSSEGNYRWHVSVQDSGPGLPPGPMSLLAQQLKPKPDLEQSAVMHRDASTDSLELPPATLPPGGKRVGEGIGLHIVKRLCELVEATLEVETETDRGTIFRIRLPVKFGDS